VCADRTALLDASRNAVSMLLRTWTGIFYRHHPIHTEGVRKKERRGQTRVWADVRVGRCNFGIMAIRRCRATLTFCLLVMDYAGLFLLAADPEGLAPLVASLRLRNEQTRVWHVACVFSPFLSHDGWPPVSPLGELGAKSTLNVTFDWPFAGRANQPLSTISLPPWAGSSRS
jgi:hypothetical protein